MPTPVSRSRPPDEASRLRRVRRYAVPRWMIERATERRLAGDWRGACAAAGVDVELDLAAVADAHGREAAAELADDLHHFAPDLLRWHLPRPGRGRTTITPGQTIVLRKAGERGFPQLHVATPRWMVNGPQRLSLEYGPVGTPGVHLETDWVYCAFFRNVVQSWTASRHLWDARHASELRERCGGDGERAPFFDPDGTPRAPDGPRGAAETAPERTERITALHERGEVEAAFAAAGIELDTAPVELDWAKVDRLHPVEVFARMPLALTRLEPEVRRLAELDAAGAGTFWIPHTQHSAILLEPTGPHGLRVRLIENEPGDEPRGAVILPEASWRRLPDLDLMRDGGTPPEHLHPLVRDALFPGRAAAAGPVGPPDPAPPAPVRVRCQGEWHEVRSRGGVLDIPHGEDERRRERALRAFGGANAGCFAVQEAWTSGQGRLPRGLRDQRRELFERAAHGDTPGVLRLLDAGVDPRVRGPRRRTLMHMLNLLDHEELLPRLLAAGLDVDARDTENRTPLFVAICDEGSVRLVQDLLAAGARIDVMCEIHGEELSLLRLIELHVRDELDFLRDRILAEHPELAEEE